jgi:H/ACA ribonucleoprotein complex subunit 3
MTTKTLIFNKEKIQVDDKDSLGTGGEATVVLYKKHALKIYHNPSPQRAKKLKDFIDLKLTLPDNIACPLDLVYDEKSNIVGFSMHVAKKCKEAVYLSNKKNRNQEQITPNEIITFFKHMLETLQVLHTNNIVVGDYNDMNVLYNNSFLSVFIDVDSFQFGKYPCAVGTEQFLDPRLYGVDLSLKQYFSKETDWYSYAVMLFKCLLLTHPFGGVHNTLQTIVDRAKNKISVFDSSVVYPRIAIKPETLSIELLDYFDKIFKLDQRIELPMSLLDSHKNSFVKCNVCNNYYYKGRGKCSVCFVPIVQPTVNIQQIVVTQDIHDDFCICDILFQTEGTILFSKVLDDNRIIVIEFNGMQTNLHIISDKDKKDFKLWSGHTKDVQYDFFKNYLVLGVNDELQIFEVTLSLQPVLKTTTLKYDGYLIFSCSSTKLYRLAEQTLLSSEIFGKNIADTVITQTLQNQTWFKVGRTGLGFCFFRVFNQYHYFVFSPKGRYEFSLPKIEGKIIEVDAEISISTVLFLVKSLHPDGRTYSHYFLIDDTGKVIDTMTTTSINSETMRNITGKTLAGSSIIHPTDVGIVIEKHKQLSLKKQTEKYVDSSDTTYLYKDGILVVSEHKVSFLRLIKK